eukprot:TRINITY_DN12115_c0_g1_i1.p1 TRINITY_DN12115_c0_g1~~TRINITY_DN12115_c0_g1_i1.p1  ORF type:complete len:385 (+),score=51.49 TRINITY_DN12115_c0_g1_i1:952-2106(+)
MANLASNQWKLFGELLPPNAEHFKGEDCCSLMDFIAGYNNGHCFFTGESGSKYLLTYQKGSSADTPCQQIFEIQALHEKPVSRLLKNTMPLTIAQYNVFARPFVVANDGQQERLESIPHFLLEEHKRLSSEHGGLDVICFNEVFADKPRQALKEALQKFGWAHQTEVIGGTGTGVFQSNGGVMVASRWPIERKAEFVFPISRHADAMAAKGVVYTCIRKSLSDVIQLNFHVFATHLQAWKDSADIRRQQVRHLKAFIHSQRIPSDEPVFVVGDLNIDPNIDEGEVNTILGILEGQQPTLVGDTQGTYDPANSLVVDDESGGKTAMYDYILPVGKFGSLLDPSVEVIRAQAAKPLSFGGGALSQQRTTSDLSDHYPLIAKMQVIH